MYPETNGEWKKYENNPVLGGQYGTCFDVMVITVGDILRMYFSWRPEAAIAVVESKDGIHWSEPVIVLGPRNDTGWEKVINRAIVLEKDGKYLMWYTGQYGEDNEHWDLWHSKIGFAESTDGLVWKRLDKPVMTFEEPWEKGAVMCPHVIWDEEKKLFRMWYSGGAQYEPDAIGYATSTDGIVWKKHEANPIFKPESSLKWEQNSVTACQVVEQDGWHLMFYIGFEDKNTARIGIARSKDGIANWQRLAANPIVSPGAGKWDGEACYKPFALYDEVKGQWMLWYNGRRGDIEQVGMVLHQGKDLGFQP